MKTIHEAMGTWDDFTNEMKCHYQWCPLQLLPAESASKPVNEIPALHRLGREDGFSNGVVQNTCKPLRSTKGLERRGARR